MRLIVFGSRTWWSRQAVYDDLRDSYALGYRTLIHGACPSGADYFADVFGHELGFAVERYPARWETYGPKAGPLRNEDMAARGADLAIGYRMQGESRGTDDMTRACERHGITLVKRGWWL